MASRLYHDIETRSPVDLRSCGQYVYATHPATEITMLSWALDDGPITTWYPFFNEPIPQELYEHCINPDVMLCAHNAAFERILETYAPFRSQKLFPPEIIEAIKPIGRWLCTAAKAAAAGLPRTLEGAAKALGVDAQKDLVGHRLMMKLCKPRAIGPDGSYTWFEDKDDVLREGLYCERDVAAERQIDLSLPDLSPFETEVWRLTETTNDRGIMVDPDLLARMATFVGDAERDLNARLRQTTCPLHTEGDPRACKNPGKCNIDCGCVPKVSNHLAIRKWLVEQGFPDVEERGVGKDVVAEMLESEDLDILVREVLTMRREGGKSSTAKYRAILNRLNSDSRIRGTLVYCGAATTKRFSSRGIQVQNLARGGTIPHILNALDDIVKGADVDTIGALYGPPIIVASELVRPTLIAPPGHWLARGDYSQIEDRINNWYGGQTDQLNAFRRYDQGDGPDPYRVTAGQIFGINPTSIDKEDPRRQTGKVTRLACGFGGGINAILKMARIYNIKMTETRADELKNLFREANPGIKQFWYDLDNAAMACMRDTRGTKKVVRPGLWFARGRRVLIMRLPSNMCLWYWYPKLEKVTVPWGEREAITFWSEDSFTKQWTKFSGYPGLWCENCVQATSRGLTADSLLRLQNAGLPPILSVHDENVCEVSKETYPETKQAAQAVRDIMLQYPDWARGIPINVDASAGPRYVKA